jgi:hypothetical protein
VLLVAVLKNDAVSVLKLRKRRSFVGGKQEAAQGDEKTYFFKDHWLSMMPRN